MLSNFLVGNHKFVLIIDDVGIERKSEMIMNKLLSDQNVNHDRFKENFEIEIPSKTAIVLPPISKFLNHNLASVAAIIQTLKLNKNVTQVFAWATTKNITNPLMIPFLEHMSSVVVTIKSNRFLSILTKRKFGSVKLKEYQHELIQVTWTTSIKEIKSEEQKVVQINEAETNPETLGTFKIGEFSSTELEAKKNLKLPYEIM